MAIVDKSDGSLRSAVAKAFTSAFAGNGPEWPLYLVGEDQTAKLAELIEGFQGDFPDGEGKRITSGFSYWGVLPASAWSVACADRIGYKVAGQGISTFAERWPAIRDALEDKQNYHYVSLGPGTGDKDATVLKALGGERTGTLYFPVDMSAEMLGLASLVTSRAVGSQNTLAIQLDFSLRQNLRLLRAKLDAILPGEPILFSMLGNSLGNVDHDQRLLKYLSEELLRHPSDRLLVEVATTKGVDERRLDAAQREYRLSNSFKQWVVSALFAYTNLPRELQRLVFTCSADDDRGLTLRVFYRNSDPRAGNFLLFDFSSIPFEKNECIRVELTRKYLSTGIDTLLKGAELDRVIEKNQELDSTHGFGLSLLLLRREESAAPMELDGRTRDLLASAAAQINAISRVIDRHIQDLVLLRSDSDARFSHDANEELKMWNARSSRYQSLLEPLASDYKFLQMTEVSEVIKRANDLGSEILGTGWNEIADPWPNG
jgi:L-histidine Nalpha-methyltransferase